MVYRRRSSAVSSPAPHTVSGCDALVRLWMLRLLVPLGGSHEYVQQDRFRDEETARFLGLYERLEAQGGLDLPEPRTLYTLLRELYEEAEAAAAQAMPVGPENLRNNCRLLGDLLRLSEAELRVLEFAVMLRVEPMLHDCGTMLGMRITTLHLQRILCVVLGLDDDTVKATISRQGTLAQTGLVCGPASAIGDLDDKLDLISRDFPDAMLNDVSDPVELFRGRLVQSEPAHLGAADFAHLASDLQLLRPYLRFALASEKPGVNVLLFGPPGTGKTQFGRMLAAELGVPMFDVPSEDSDGDPIRGAARLRALRTGQAILSGRLSLLMFDEIEDAFADGAGFGAPSTAQTHKAWINHTLETNPVPTIWLSNNIRQMDPAFIRRFDMLIEMPVPPLTQRRQIIEEAACGLLSPAGLERVAQAEQLAPAVLTRAADVIRCIEDELPANEHGAALERLVNHTLQAQGHRTLAAGAVQHLPGHYDPAFINSSEDLLAITDGLRAARSGRLCLYGPPGTGKTAFGRWLATQLAMPLLLKRASDIMSMWVGGTEQNLARAFREAEEAGALLLIDEVDSFLQDRRQAQRSWEVSGVNEMLTQMESFSGVFIASTNLVEGLDPASLRRFDLKLKFDFLRPEQAWAIFMRQSLELGLAAPKTSLQTRLRRLTTLTPGDFAAIARQHRFRPFPHASAMLAALEAECALKGHAPRAAIGFI